jgi:hypothetical protein
MNRILIYYRDPLERAHVDYGYAHTMMTILKQDGTWKNQGALDRIKAIGNKAAAVLHMRCVPISEWGLPECQGK